MSQTLKIAFVNVNSVIPYQPGLGDDFPWSTKRVIKNKSRIKVIICVKCQRSRSKCLKMRRVKSFPGQTGVCVLSIVYCVSMMYTHRIFIYY